MPQELKSALLAGAAPARGDAGRAGLHPHQAPGRPAAEASGEERGQRRADSRQPLAAAADRSAGRVQEREVPGPRGDGHRRPGDRHRGAGPRRELRRAEGAGGLHPPGRADRPRGGRGRRVHVRGARGGAGSSGGSSGRLAGGCRGCVVPDFDYAAKPEGELEVPLGDRIAAIRARKAEDRARANAKAARKASASAPSQRSPSHGPGRGRPGHRPGARPR